MNKDMKVKAWWLMRVGLLLAVVLAGSAGCERPAECDKLEVVCADELQNEIFTHKWNQETDPRKDKLFSEARIVNFFQATNANQKIKFDTDLYDFQTTCVYENGDPGDSFEQFVPEGIRFLVTLKALLVKCQIKVSDKNPLLGTSQTYEFCASLKSKSIKCSEFKQKPVQLSKDSAAEIAVNVSCLRLTYREIEKEIDTAKGKAKIVWGDMTWVVNAAGRSYDMVGAPSVSGFHYAEPSGPFVSGKGAVDEMLGPTASKSKPVTFLASNQAAELRLPVRWPYGKLVNVDQSNENVLQAGWYVAFDKTGKAVNIGCSIKQNKLAGILDTALKSKPVGDQTVHIFFNENAPKGQLGGDHGWCYGLTKDGAAPLFKPHSTALTGEPCSAL